VCVAYIEFDSSDFGPNSIWLTGYARRVTNALEAMLDLDHPVKVSARDWANATLADGDTMHARGLVDRSDWQSAASYGLLGSHAPRELGGLSIGAVESSLMYEGLGASSADNGLVFAIASQAMAPTKAIANSASPAQRERWFPALCDGRLFASFAMSEPGAGSDPWGLTTTATQDEQNGWILNGTKTWCTLGPICDVALVFAVTDQSRGQWGITAFIVPADADGMQQGPPIEKSGFQSCPFGELRFEDCRVDNQAVLGSVGSGAAIFTKIVEQERAFLYAAQIGAMERVLDLAIDFARSRVQAGVHIGTHQSVANRLVDVKSAHEHARLTLYKAAARHDAGLSVGLAGPLTKLATADAAISSVLDAIKTLGAQGLTIERGLERELRDSLSGLAFSGTPDLARNLVAEQLGLNRRLQ